MLNESNKESKKVEVHINLSQTKIVTTDQCNITVYKYFWKRGSLYISRAQNQTRKRKPKCEIKCRVNLTSIAFGQLNYIFKGKYQFILTA